MSTHTLLLSYTESESEGKENENRMHDLRMPNIEQKPRPKQAWGEPRLLSRADSFLRKEFCKLKESHPHIKASKLPLSALQPACKVAAHFLVPCQEVRRRYAEYRADAAASAYDKGSIKLYHAFSSASPYNNLCSLIEGKWSSSLEGWTSNEGWQVRITCDGSVTYVSVCDDIEMSGGKLEWLHLSGVSKAGALCVCLGPSRWRLNFQKSTDNFLVWNLNRTALHDSDLESSIIVYERIQ